jgi:glycosyltransferase involved in cell wall biosynthesis
MRILGTTLGNPHSAATYSGVPYHLFAQLERSRSLVGRFNVDLRRPIDLARGFIDFHRSIESKRPVRNAYWRFLPENIKLQTRRLKPLVENQPKHDAVLQIGVGGIPAMTGTLMAAHAEISVQAAATLEIFSASYGFARQRNRLLARAIEGELEFLSQCDMIWTNTRWTADTFAHHGLPVEKFWIHAPACNTDDPGLIERQADAPPHVLFAGKDWVRKGGPLLLEAFAILRKRFAGARLTIMGCLPPLRDPGVEVIGFLDKKIPAEARRIDEAFRSATVFCMPSHWESVGLVYMEAALYGLPVVMLRGQGRDQVFPETMAVHLDSAAVNSLADVLIQLHEAPEASQKMGRAGRRHVLDNYTWPVVAERLLGRMKKAVIVEGKRC